MRGSKQEAEMVRLLQQKALLEKYGPLLREISRYDSPDTMIRKALPMSTLGLIISQFSENETIALKARTEIINRGLGKPVERSISVHGDLSQLNEKDLDNQLKRLLGKTSFDITPQVKAKAPALKQKRKPRKAPPLVLNEEATTRRDAEETLHGSEAGIASSPTDEGTS